MSDGDKLPRGKPFEKGQSGNPAGRPKGSKNKAKSEVEAQPKPQTADELAHQEAYRIVAIREGEKITEMSVLQATIRSLSIKAMKGDVQAGSELIKRTERQEQREEARRLEFYKILIEYKESWTEAMKRGMPFPAGVYPHPDDIYIDVRAGVVRVDGPLNDEEQQRLDEDLEKRDAFQAAVSALAKEYKRAKDDFEREFILEDWHNVQRAFDTYNDFVYPRYRAKLKDRSLAAGASQEGDQRRRILGRL